MRSVGILAEYNPFHNGHLTQLRYIREKLGPRVAIVIALSSHFTQRGSAALQNLRQRTRAALEGGADLVLLLPQLFSAAPAEGFARGGMRLLAGSGLVDSVACSAETFEPELLHAVANFLSTHLSELRAAMQTRIRDGLSPQQAESQALAEVSANPAWAALMDQPNNRLAIAYLRELAALPEGWPQPHFFLCPRFGGAEHAACMPQVQASAEAIRGLLAACRQDAGDSRVPLLRQAGTREPERHTDGSSSASLTLSLSSVWPQLREQMPAPALASLLADLSARQLPREQRFWDLAVLLLQREDSRSLAAYSGMSGGLAAYLLGHFGEARSLDDLASRNFTRARLRRALLALLLGLREEEREAAGDTPAFLLPLGFTPDGRYLLKKRGKQALLPILSRSGEGAALAASAGRPELLLQYRLEQRAARLRSFLCQPEGISNLLEGQRADSASPLSPDLDALLSPPLQLKRQKHPPLS